ncbi:MAG: cytochrome c3 family protein [Desulfobacteraceae bacterium]|nr:cytochrome c3 family protein [Desulfobacteraceae bacterium]
MPLISLALTAIVRLARKNPDEKAGPVKCAGCHDLMKQKAIEKVAEVPRLERKQPDAVLVKTSVTEVDSKTHKMPPVAYNHKAHEGYNDTCRVCHHASMDACSKCHTISGSKDGKFVNLERSMHTAKSQKACIGCHEEKQDAKKCAGCHDMMEKGKMKGNCL